MTTIVAETLDASAPAVLERDAWAHGLSALEHANYLALTTFRRSGAAVVTPVWFAHVGEALYIITDQRTGKVKRISSNPEVRVAPCTARGQVTGAALDGVAHVLPATDSNRGMRALTRKYGWLFIIFGWFHRLQRTKPVLLEIVRRD